MTRRNPLLASLTLALFAMASVTSSAFADAHGKALPDPDGKPADMSKPVQVFIIMGQSNTLDFGKVKGGEGSLENAVKNKKLYPYLVDDAGNWTVRKDVRNVQVMGSGGPGKTRVLRNDWLTVNNSGRNPKIGIDVGIGHHLGHAVDAPVMILRSSIGNRSLAWDLLPPGSPRHEVQVKDRKSGEMVTMVTPAHKDEVRHPSWVKGQVPDPPKHTWYAGLQYLGDVARAKDVLKNLDKYYPGAKGYEVAGFLWWQGDKDSRNAAHSAVYEKNLVQLIKTLRKEFNAPNAKFVTASLGQTKKGATDGGGLILNAMMAVDGKSGKYPEFKGNVSAVYTHPLSKGSSSGSHYGGNAETYMNVGQAMGQAMVELLKK